MRSLLFLLSLLLAASLNALDPVEITNPDAFIEASGAKSNKTIWKSLKGSGFTKDQLKMIDWCGQPSVRPMRLRDRIHDEDRPYFTKMKALEVVRDSVNGVGLLMIAAPENLHLPKEIRPLCDLYLIFPLDAYKTGAHWSRLPSIEDLVLGPSTEGLSKVRITDPSALFGRADLRSDIDTETMLHKLMGYRAVDHLQLRCNENGWPTGMNTLKERNQLQDEIMKYRAYALTEWDGKQILIIPARKNKHIARRARPYVDIYLVMDSKG